MLNRKNTQSQNDERPKVSTKKPWWLLNLLYAGVSERTHSEDIRRILIINLFSLVGGSFTLPLGIHALIIGKTMLSVGLFFMTVVYISSHLILRFTHTHMIPGNMVVYPLYLLMLFLVYSGGVNGTGHVWIYCVPAVALFMKGLKQGLFEVLVFVLAMIGIMFFMDSPFNHLGYHEELKSRILLSFVVVAFLSAIYEYSMSSYNTELRRATSKLKKVAETDALTGLLNRRGMQQRLSRLQMEDLWILIADVDHFKKINDQYGHDIGDNVLSMLSDLIRDNLPEGSLASRWGGEEFLLVVENVSSEEALDIGDALRKAVEQHVFYTHDNESFKVTASLGVAALNDTTTLSEAMKLADKHLYEAKASGRNLICGC